MIFMHRESYRSGHNELHSKCSCPVLGHVGSNPTLSARNLRPQAGLPLAGFVHSAAFLGSISSVSSPKNGLFNPFYSAQILRKRLADCLRILNLRLPKIVYILLSSCSCSNICLILTFLELQKTLTIYGSFIVKMAEARGSTSGYDLHSLI